MKKIWKFTTSLVGNVIMICGILLSCASFGIYIWDRTHNDF